MQDRVKDRGEDGQVGVQLLLLLLCRCLGVRVVVIPGMRSRRERTLAKEALCMRLDDGEHSGVGVLADGDLKNRGDVCEDLAENGEKFCEEGECRVNAD